MENMDLWISVLSGLILPFILHYVNKYVKKGDREAVARGVAVFCGVLIALVSGGGIAEALQYVIIVGGLMEGVYFTAKKNGKLLNKK